MKATNAAFEDWWLDRHIVIRKSEIFGWYVIAEKTGNYSDYLHGDGAMRSSTRNERGEFTAYFPTKKEAEDALNRFLKNHNAFRRYHSSIIEPQPLTA